MGLVGEFLEGGAATASRLSELDEYAQTLGRSGRELTEALNIVKSTGAEITMPQRIAKWEEIRTTLKNPDIAAEFGGAEELGTELDEALPKLKAQIAQNELVKAAAADAALTRKLPKAPGVSPIAVSDGAAVSSASNEAALNAIANAKIRDANVLAANRVAFQSSWAGKTLTNITNKAIGLGALGTAGVAGYGLYELHESKVNEELARQKALSVRGASECQTPSGPVIGVPASKSGYTPGPNHADGIFVGLNSKEPHDKDGWRIDRVTGEEYVVCHPEAQEPSAWAKFCKTALDKENELGLGSWAPLVNAGIVALAAGGVTSMINPELGLVVALAAGAFMYFAGNDMLKNGAKNVTDHDTFVANQPNVGGDFSGAASGNNDQKNKPTVPSGFTFGPPLPSPGH